MSLPSFSSSNFYSFCCTLGAVILFYAIIFPYNISREIEHRKVETEKQSDMLDVEIRCLRKSGDVLDGRIKDREVELERIRKNYITKEVKGLWDNEVDKLFDLVSANSDKIRDFNLKCIELRYASKSISTLSKELNEVLVKLWLVLFLGISIFSYGVINWRRLQKISDQHMKSCIENSLRESSKKRCNDVYLGR
ncbi:hypothetical protein SAMN05660337_1754 [Maridesulfovibrio ferrireducens]|uniref:Uncharacterized protein n=1 Tax=Maridesulfovibrio ferrireducens TaxID=246191 RepID=A0A1G9FY42_9BACT|nr:hypothetical protein [Maridesulfovibrio ferrireducens]SDK93298.1 hypothetical protein SAMN05660337_1754 [Maridesulfovibrio ferrireducens]